MTRQRLWTIARGTLMFWTACVSAMQRRVTPSAASIWPLPQESSFGTRTSYLSPAFYMRCASSLCPEPLPRAMRRYRELSFVAGSPRDQTGSEDSIALLEVSVAEDVPLALGASEVKKPCKPRQWRAPDNACPLVPAVQNYSLSVPVNGVATLSAHTQWGALRGLESFSQLFRWTGSGDHSYVVTGTPVEVRDWPRFPWRSVLLDSSRHFLTVSAVKSTLDAMSYAKVRWVWSACARAPPRPAPVLAVQPPSLARRGQRSVAASVADVPSTLAARCPCSRRSL